LLVWLFALICRAGETIAPDVVKSREFFHTRKIICRSGGLKFAVASFDMSRNSRAAADQAGTAVIMARLPEELGTRRPPPLVPANTLRAAPRPPDVKEDEA
jgi:hypothetical protein